jgi:hypothetical protein
MGYVRAGFRVIGVDIVPRPNYPFTFVQMDALEYVAWLLESRLIHRFALIHAPPPCQHGAAITKGTNAHLQDTYPDLYKPTRDLLDTTGTPYVIENTYARPDVVLCGEMFGLGVTRHRKIELGGWSTDKPTHIEHRGYVRGWRHGEYRDGPYVAAYGDGGGKATVPEMQEAMGIPWTDVRKELTEAIPPAYTEWIGTRFLSRA